jgi:DNA-binding LacI/PurR family transcriptional regulator
MVTIADVALEAGVSVATVSRVINHNGSVSQETTHRVKEAIERLAYEPNILARNFRKSESRVILILAPNITNPYYSQILTGIGFSARRLGYSFMICTTGGESDQERDFLDMLAKRRADGAIMLATGISREDIEHYASKYPIVQCSEYYPDTSVAHVAIDNYRSSYQVVEYLLSLGHERIATISSVNNYPSTHQRLAGYRDALLKAGIKPDDALVRYGSFDYSFSSGLAAAQSLLQQKQRPTAIFCISDMLALGAINGAQNMGLEVPRDVSVVGFDDVAHATMFRPHITTMAQPCYEIGQRATELLYRLMRSEPCPCQGVMLECQLVVRDSCAAYQVQNGR